jgi:exodeoxyribonuclease V beta subunit
MNAAAAQPAFDVLRFPLRGSRLIEASAGTGKTWAIAALYLRLVLGHGGGHGFDRPLAPPSILVVTFTEAATKELRDRIRSRLAEAAAAFDRSDLPGPGPERDPVLAGLLAEHPRDRWPALAQRLREADQWMDESAISTIHAWCHRMLREHAFDSGSLFTQELDTDGDALLAEVVRSYWREHFYRLPAEAAAKVRKLWTSPDRLLGAVRGLVGWIDALPEIVVPEGGLAALADATTAALAPWKQAWRDQDLAGGLLGAIDAAIAAGRIPARSMGQRRKWTAEIAEWANGDAATPTLTPTAWDRLSRAGMRAISADGLAPFEHPALEELERLRERLRGLPALEAPYLLNHAARWCAGRLAAEKERRALLGFDDLLTRLDAALRGEAGERLAARIRERFPVALIDEFQDTDPVQYRIFDRVYRVAQDDPGTAIILIGDPKQSIYGFRNADIHTYLTARAATAGRHATLGTNHRSSQAMVDAVNRVFRQAEERAAGRGAFRFRTGSGDTPLPFHDVAAAGRDEAWTLDDRTAPALTLWCPDDAAGELSAEGFRERMGAACAQEIVRLLRAGQSGRTGAAGFLREDDGRWRALQPADIAVLVDTGTQAAVVREALARRGVRTVYLSDRESVFGSEAAADLQCWLQACAEPGDERRLRAALATATIGLDWATLEGFNHDEPAWEAVVERFRGYQREWRRAGVLPMLRRLLHDFGLPERLLAADRERELTDLLHLAEWLQRASATLDGEHALIRHLAAQRRDSGAVQGEDPRRLRLESDSRLVRVVTVHKSKGLEYPLVFLPFAAAFRKIDRNGTTLRWHDAGASRTRVVVSKGSLDAEVALADDERLSEDLRKLYVALTRARFAVWAGVAPMSDLHLGALGYLVDPDRSVPAAELRDALARLKGDCDAIAIASPPSPDGTRYRPPSPATAWRPEPPLPAPSPPWWIASYSGLVAGAAAVDAAASGAATDDDADRPSGDATGSASAAEDIFGQCGNEGEDDAPAATAGGSAREGPGASWRAAGSADTTDADRGLLHDFPRGARPGSFLHDLLEWTGRQGFETVARDPAGLDDFIARRANLSGYATWIPALRRWLRAWLDARWDLTGLAPGIGPATPRTLPRIQVEMEFWLPVNGAPVREIDRLVRQHTLGGADRPSLTPQRLDGLLKGFVDLVFEHEGRYFVADYKSNRLGGHDADYTADAMRRIVLDKRYELQYVLYTLALHRLLRSRLGARYDYDRHVGGAVYLFLRGHAAPGGGLHLERPPLALVEALDALFAGRAAAVDPPVRATPAAEPQA